MRIADEVHGIVARHLLVPSAHSPSSLPGHHCLRPQLSARLVYVRPKKQRTEEEARKGVGYEFHLFLIFKELGRPCRYCRQLFVFVRTRCDYIVHALRTSTAKHAVLLCCFLHSPTSISQNRGKL